jgi:hypothetical protein
MINLPTLLEYKDNTEYQAVFLEIFNLKQYDTTKINNELTILKNDLIKDDIFRELLTVSASKLLSEDLDLGLIALFSYDYLNYFIECLREYYDNNSTTKVNELIILINK